MRAAIYIRVSTEEQRINGLSVEMQRDVLTEYANKNNMEIVDYYIDAGLTARKKLTHRKELIRLLEDIKSGFIDIIIFTKLDRWFRNIADYYKVQEVLDTHKVNWKTIFENYDTSTANGRLHINIMLSIAQDEADRTSERIKAVFENKRSKGETPASMAPIGYKIINSKLLVDEDKKQIAIDIFNYYDLHHSVMGCVRMAREKHNFKIYDYTVRRMFENTIYIGEFKGYSNFCEALIDRGLFERIKKYREVREFKNQLVAGRVYLFSSLVECKECKHIMTSSYNKQQQKNSLKEFHYYRCKEALHQRCPNHMRANEDVIEEYLLTHLKSKLRDVLLTIDRSKKTSQNKKIDTSAVKKRLDKLKDLYLDDLIDKDSYKIEYNSLTTQIAAANMTQSDAKERYEKLINQDIVNVYKLLTREEQKVFWLGIIDKIVFDKNKNIEFYLK